jgi:hypothetical protein
VTVRLDAGPVVLRGDEETTAALATWIVAQLAAGHDDRALCLAAAIAPTETQNWLWLNWLPHARPSSAPLSGPHIATGTEAAADLLDRVRGLVRTRAELDVSGPSVVAVLDARLGARPDDPTLHSAGLHMVFLNGAPVPPGASTVDVSGDRCRVTTAVGMAEGLPDLVPPGFGRDVADLMSES